MQKIVVVGGGTAGWLSAGILARHLGGRGVSVTLIEAPNIPTIGVGEGTFPTMLNTLSELGISEREFVAHANVGFKQGITFNNWLHNPAERPHSYLHLFDNPAQFSNLDMVSLWLSEAADTPFAEAVAPQAGIIQQGLGPKAANTAPYSWMAKYAYHLDAGAFVALLKAHCQKALDVQHIAAEIVDVSLDEAGYIASVNSNDGRVFEGDVFIDCTGFRSRLLGQALGVPFLDYRHVLPVNKAVALQVPYNRPDAPMASSTLSTAQAAGWIWDIGLQTRRGLGYVYSDAHTDPTEAEAVLRRYAETTGGVDCSDLSARQLGLEVGFRARSWEKNCIAIGFAGGFVEPLEATAISMVEAGARSVAIDFPENREAMDARAKKYNARFRYRWEKIVDFIKLHYCLSKRTDSAFWHDNRNPASIPDSLKENLEYWRHFPTSEGDFYNRNEMFSLASYQYILYGMEYLPARRPRINLTEAQRQQAKAAIPKQVQQARGLLPDHRALVQQFAAGC
ncbi:tryptophan 7-halogenase [Simiduia sp. 21SJ11W-1]|uniref:tryptophan halogenase family protein n=1 Tax=Simiduia sp. 21SJ11W-1 TaxID=2909669 RepID=UPI00209D9655|nr:tryptophan halogenase family protein [Simiduia sp. 21SJ11W-1]UTA46550.1 tryptophan 7-halogenase [Simiduia sp. 21SJ11W-1]